MEIEKTKKKLFQHCKYYSYQRTETNISITWYNCKEVYSRENRTENDGMSKRGRDLLSILEWQNKC